jgi:hypothetical protein
MISGECVSEPKGSHGSLLGSSANDQVGDQRAAFTALRESPHLDPTAEDDSSASILLKLKLAFAFLLLSIMHRLGLLWSPQSIAKPTRPDS